MLHIIENGYGYEDFQEGLDIISKKIIEDGDEWRPDYIVAITRGGLVPGVRLSHILKIPLVTIKWSSSADENEHNFWIPEDINAGMKVLIVDDIVDSGETIKTLIEDWKSSIREDLNLDNLRVCAMIENTAQEIEVHYSHIKIDRNSVPEWINFWWEAKHA